MSSSIAGIEDGVGYQLRAIKAACGTWKRQRKEFCVRNSRKKDNVVIDPKCSDPGELTSP